MRVLVTIASPVTQSVSDLGEHALIAHITARLRQPSWVIVGPGDDAAVVEPERGALSVLTTDSQVEDVHFDRRFVPPDAIGHRALAVNLSDLAAMGGRPRAALLSLMLPDAFDLVSLDRMLDGLLSLAARHHVSLVGGNITRSPGPLVVNVTATGTVRRRGILTRSGARPGDEVYVTGSIGEALVGLRALQARCTSSAEGTSVSSGYPSSEARYLRPEPRVRAGILLGRTRAASACMDLSDGLADGLRRIAEASHVGIALDAASIPIGEEVVRWHRAHGHDARMAAIAGGDDYELLFTVRPRNRGRLRAARRAFGDLPIMKIGVVTKDRRILVADNGSVRDLPHGFEHFR